MSPKERAEALLNTAQASGLAITADMIANAILDAEAEVARTIGAECAILESVIAADRKHFFESFALIQARADIAEAELKRYRDAVDAQPWATDEPIRVLLDRVTSTLATQKNALERIIATEAGEDDGSWPEEIAAAALKGGAL